MKRVAVVILPSVIVAACGGAVVTTGDPVASTAEPRPTAESGAAIAAACASWYDAQLEFYYRCGAGPDFPSKDTFVDGCVGARTARGAPAGAALQMQACTASIAKATSCHVLPHCPVALGLLPEGSGCVRGALESSITCASGRCGGRPLPGRPAHCGACAPTAGPGEACVALGSGDGVPCRPGLSCINAVCVDVPLVEGAPCADRESSWSGACPDGLHCGPKSTCERLPERGEVCSAACATNLVCRRSVCEPLSELGDACSRPSDCMPGLACGPGGTCAHWKTSGVGGPCGAQTGAQCEDRLECVSAEGPRVGRCQEPAAAGQACSDGVHHERCGAWLACVDGVCKRRTEASCE